MFTPELIERIDAVFNTPEERRKFRSILTPEEKHLLVIDIMEEVLEREIGETESQELWEHNHADL